MANIKEKSIPTYSEKWTSEQLVREFYELRKNFEKGYSGQWRSSIYKETREFTIALNNGIFQVNQLHLQKSISTNEIADLKNILSDLKNDLKFLSISS